MKSSLAILGLVIAVSASFAAAKDTPVEWSLQKAPYAPLTANVGDTV